MQRREAGNNPQVPFNRFLLCHSPARQSHATWLGHFTAFGALSNHQIDALSSSAHGSRADPGLPIGLQFDFESRQLLPCTGELRGWNSSQESGERTLSMVGNVWRFLHVRKKFWLLPALLTSVLFVVAVVLSQGSAIAPFVYSLF